MKGVNRRTFLTALGATSAVTIVPRRVLGGQGYVAPSDMVLLAQVGCGTQSQRQVNTGLIARPDVQLVAMAITAGIPTDAAAPPPSGPARDRSPAA